LREGWRMDTQIEAVETGAAEIKAVRVKNPMNEKEDQESLFLIILKRLKKRRWQAVYVCHPFASLPLREKPLLENNAADYFYQEYRTFLNNNGKRLTHEQLQGHGYHLIDQIQNGVHADSIASHSRESSHEYGVDVSSDKTNKWLNDPADHTGTYRKWYNRLTVPPEFNYHKDPDNHFLIDSITHPATGQTIHGDLAVMFANQYTIETQGKLSSESFEIVDIRMNDLFDRLASGEVSVAELKDGIKPPNYIVDHVNDMKLPDDVIQYRMARDRRVPS
jgi:hypothetical protein